MATGDKYFTIEELTGMSADEFRKYKELRKRFVPFGIEAVKAGHEIYTRDGRRVRVLCTDRRGTGEGALADVPMPVVALVPQEHNENYEMTLQYTADGHCTAGYRFGVEDGLDLFAAGTLNASERRKRKE